ncbi:hypothetical protein GOP47_0009600 [Adiantum capillus-veneris]|uniref:Cyclin-like domain-containing protein n=1 Tax=Adiantum capillus-veneris TaxID=13818 RepID=A0A9D4UX58_ADICA|nr:hypothetical protein GOP47_0009600 [Adiantum capillus-veneris]
MADFQTSSHHDRWILNPQALVEKRRGSNQRAIAALKKYGATRVEVQADGSLAYPGAPIAEDGPVGEKLPEPLVVDEEILIQRFYEQKIQQVCAAFSFPHKIQATAILYFKRFFLNWSVMEHDPKQIMLTCIYISCKVEEFHVSAEEFGKGIQQDPQAVLKNELCLLQGLNFDLIVYGPYRSLEGFIFDMENFFHAKDEAFLEKLKDLKEAAIFVADKLMLTDAALQFPPGQLALAALQDANLEEKAVDFDRYLRSIADRQHEKLSYLELLECLNSVLEKVKSVRPVNEDDVKRIDRKLKYCRNPSLQDENKKRERKSKHKTKRSSQDAE